MPISSHLLKRLSLPPIFVAVNFNQGTVHSFLTYNQASRGVIRLVKRKHHAYDPFFCLFRINKSSGSRAKPLGRFGRFPTMDYDPNQCWGEWHTWDDEEPFIPKGDRKRRRYRISAVNVEPVPTYKPYQMETPVEDSFQPETPMRFHFYVDRRELMVRPVLITGRYEDQVRYDWPCFGSWGRDGVDFEKYFHGTAEWAMEQLLEFMATEGNLKPWMGGDDGV